MTPVGEQLWAHKDAREDFRPKFQSIPVVLCTDHINNCRLQDLPFERVNLKHVRWWTALTADGSRFEHLAGKSWLMQIPDALSRDPPNRDELLKWRADDLARMKKTIAEFEVEE